MKSLLQPSLEERALRRARRELAADLRSLVACSTSKDKRGRARMDTLDPHAEAEVKRKKLIIAEIDRLLK